MVSTLTRNAVDRMVNNTSDPNEEYVIQVLSAPSMVSDQLFKFTYSDGFTRSKKGYLVTDAALRKDEIKELCILKVRKFINTEQNIDKERIIIATFEVLYSNVTDLIGKPIEYKHYKNNNMQNPEGSNVIPDRYLSRNAQQAQRNVAATASNNNRQPTNAFGSQGQNNAMQKPASNNSYGHNKVTQNPQSMNQNNASSAGMPKAGSEDEKDLERISSLSVGMEGAFKARVTKKGDTKDFKSAKGEGILFSIDVVDSWGSETTLTFFNSEATKYFSHIHVGHIYVFKNGIVKMNTNKRFNKGDVVITVGRDTVIMAASDDGRIPQIQINRVQIANVQSLNKDSPLDIIGIVRQNTECRAQTLKDQTQKMRRDIKIYDESCAEIDITIWGDKAETIDAHEDDIIVIKDAYIGEFREKKQVNVGFGTQFFLNPDQQKFPDTAILVKWRNNTDLSGLFAEFDNKSSTAFQPNGETGALENVSSLESSFMQLKEEVGIAKNNHMFNDDFKIWREIRAIIHAIRDSPLYYDSCLKCKRKIQADADKFYCSYCNLPADQPTSRYIASILIADSTDFQWVSMYDDLAKKIIGYSADEFRLLGDNIEERKKKLQKVYNQEFRFLLLVKAEKDQNGEYREKYVAHDTKENNTAYESRRILNALEKYMEAD